MWMLKYGTARMLPHHINYILVKAWDAFKVSSGKFLRDRFVKTKLRSLATTDLTTNTQACAASVQVTSGSKYEEINEISCRTVAPIGSAPFISCRSLANKVIGYSLKLLLEG